MGALPARSPPWANVGGKSHPGLRIKTQDLRLKNLKQEMRFPPKAKDKYVFDNTQDKRIFNKLVRLKNKKLTKEQEKLVKFLYSQLEKNWRDPLEKFIDKLLE